jgi:hypothetical protein
MELGQQRGERLFDHFLILHPSLAPWEALARHFRLRRLSLAMEIAGSFCSFCSFYSTGSLIHQAQLFVSTFTGFTVEIERLQNICRHMHALRR